MKQTRRRYLAAAGALGLATLAGCSQGEPTGTPTAEPTGTPTDEPTATPTSGSGSTDEAPLIVMHDTVIDAATTAEGQAPCSLTNRFLHGQKVIFRINVVDPETGEELGKEGLSRVAVDIKTGDGQTVEAYYGPHPPQDPSDEYWVAPWTIPESFPAGPVDFEILAEDGREPRSYGFDIPPSNLTVLEGSYTGSDGTPTQSG